MKSGEIKIAGNKHLVPTLSPNTWSFTLTRPAFAVVLEQESIKFGG
ncbi:MAG: hypothetical protein R6V03_00795 [Kiritimatiellia bacterium]